MHLCSYLDRIFILPSKYILRRKYILRNKNQLNLLLPINFSKPDVGGGGGSRSVLTKNEALCFGGPNILFGAFLTCDTLGLNTGLKRHRLERTSDIFGVSSQGQRKPDV